MTMAELIENARTLPLVPIAATTAYKIHMQAMIRCVDSKLSGIPTIQSLIGPNSLPIMYENHRHHASFMATVFGLGDYELLCRTVPWVYRTYHAHSFSFDYFPVELKAWREAVDTYLWRDLGEPVREVYDWMIRNHEQFVLLSQIDQSIPRPVESNWQSVKSDFLSSLIVGDHKQCLTIALENIKKPSDVECFYSQAIQPAMYEVGKLWEKGSLSVAQEHLASAIVGRVMATVSMTTIGSNKKEGKAVVTSAPNEFHEIGAWMIADVLETDGWDVSFLGANTPQKDLIRFLTSSRPDLLAISVTMAFNLETVKTTIDSIRADPLFANMKIMVGGGVLNENAQLRGALGADSFAANLGDAKRLAQQWKTTKNVA